MFKETVTSSAEVPVSSVHSHPLQSTGGIHDLKLCVNHFLAFLYSFTMYI